MLRYFEIQNKRFLPQTLLVFHDNEVYFPTFVHAAIDQDRPMGDTTTFREHAHNLYHVVLYTKSSGIYRKCGIKYKSEPGSLVIVSPGQPHNFIDISQPSVYSEITFYFSTHAGKILTLPFEELLNIYTGIQGQLQCDPVLQKETAKELLMIMIQIMDYLQSPSAMSDFYAYRALGNAFDLILTHCYAERMPDQTLFEDETILRIKHYIEEHYAEPLTADQLANLSHCSKGHLFRIFKQAFQISPLAFQQALRFEAAQRLLRFTSLRCYEIAQRVGYMNVHYFHRQFKKRTGKTPEQYRKYIR